MFLYYWNSVFQKSRNSYQRFIIMLLDIHIRIYVRNCIAIHFERCILLLTRLSWNYTLYRGKWLIIVKIEHIDTFCVCLKKGGEGGKLLNLIWPPSPLKKLFHCWCTLIFKGLIFKIILLGIFWNTWSTYIQYLYIYIYICLQNRGFIFWMHIRVS